MVVWWECGGGGARGTCDCVGCSAVCAVAAMALARRASLASPVRAPGKMTTGPGPGWPDSGRGREPFGQAARSSATEIWPVEERLAATVATLRSAPAWPRESGRELSYRRSAPGPAAAELCGRGSFAVLVQDRIGLPGVVGDASHTAATECPASSRCRRPGSEQLVDQARDTLRPGHDDRVAIGRRHVTVVLIIVENPLRLAASRFVQALMSR